MKQNKLIISGLLLVTIIIWGTVVFRIRDLKNGGDVDKVAIGFKEFVEKDLVVSKEYELLLNYPDPFLKKQEVNQIRLKPIEAQSLIYKKVNNNILEKNELDKGDRFEEVKYFGFVGNSENKKAYGFVEDDGRSFMVSEGDTLFNWKISLISNDSVVLVNGKTRTTIHAF